MNGPVRQRADLLLVARGFFDSRARARAAIEAGLVTASGVPVRRPADLLAPDAEIAAQPSHPFVSRGGVKLAGALDAFAIDPAGLSCLDIGASTGGFTDVLLRRGAARVMALDVGHGQLHASLRQDPRVVSLEDTDARRLPEVVGAASVDLAVLDVSFISLRHVLPQLLAVLKIRAQVVALIKPQFEAGRSSIGRGGIVRDEPARERAVAGIVAFADEIGLEPIGTVPSPIAGQDGNRETFLAARRRD